MRLRDVELGDVSAYARMRCDPVMMAELGGPQPREGIEEKVARDVQAAAAGDAWIKMIVPGEAAPEVVVGSVALWSHDEDGGEPITEIGWMVLPEFQGRGLAKRAVRMLLELARDDGRWGLVHAFPGTTNCPSNGICRSLGFRFAGERDVTFADRILRSNHWFINPGHRPDLTQVRIGSLSSIQRADLFGDSYSEQAQRLTAAIRRSLGRPLAAAMSPRHL
jgi:RimJ/RimL family protein N-acetyltransferase